MKVINLIICFCLLTTYSFGQQQLDTINYSVLSVTTNKVFQNNTVIKRKQTLKLTGVPPQFPNKDFFLDNHLEFKPNSELILFENRNQYTINYDDFIGKSQSKAIILNTNCSTRSTNTQIYNCCDSMPDAKFHLSSFFKNTKTINSIECLKLYFNSGAYWINGADTLNIAQKGLVDNLIFQFDTTSVSFKNNKDTLIIDSSVLPTKSHFKLFIKNNNTHEQIAEGKLIDLQSVILTYKQAGMTKEAIATTLIEGPFKEFNSNNSTDKQVLLTLAQLIKTLY